MGLIRWFKNLIASKPPRPQPSAATVAKLKEMFDDGNASRSKAAQPRKHHYAFVHRAFPAELWKGNCIIGILGNPENQDFLPGLWQQFGEQLPPEERVAATGLGHSCHWLGGEHFVILVQYPTPQKPPEAAFAAITTSPQIRYITLEKTFSTKDMTDDHFVMCEWTSAPMHLNFGDGGPATADDFLRAVCRHLKVPETVETASAAQLSRMSRSGPARIMDDLSDLENADQLQVASWREQMELKFQNRDFDSAEKFCQQIIDLKISKLGRENTKATLAYADMTDLLMAQSKFEQAEAVCRTWWHDCRKYRMLGHAETMLVTKRLADSLLAQDKQKEARDLLAYRVLYFGLCRGIDSQVAQSARADLEAISAAPDDVNP